MANARLGVVTEIEIGDVSYLIDTRVETQTEGFALRGAIELAGHDVELAIVDAEGVRLIAGSFDCEKPTALDVRRVVQTLVPELGSVVPGAELTVSAASFVVAATKGAAGDPDRPSHVVLFQAVLDTQIDLGELPLVGDQLSRGGPAMLEGIELLVASTDLDQAITNVISEALPSGVVAAPPVGHISAGPHVHASLLFGDDRRRLELALPKSEPVIRSDDGAIARRAPAAPAAGSADVKWVGIEKSIGPVRLDRVGFALDGDILGLLVDGGIDLGPVALGVEGLGVRNPLDRFHPDFQLRGVSVEFASGPIGISGALLHDDSNDAYVGSVQVALPQLAVTAYGGYQQRDDGDALFVYGVLNRPIGGPAYFFVTGLAFGFGYNRDVLLPDINDVRTFPLVAAAVDGPGSNQGEPLAVLREMQHVLPAKRGAVFLALGVKFTSFKLLESFALLVVRVGDEPTVTLLGLSRISVPAKSPTPIVQAELALSAEVNLTQGTLLVEGVLTDNSYVLSPACRLTGGFAFAAWFAGPHAGDFVVSLGGYHPDYAIPDHYPRVPRLGLSWKVPRTPVTISGWMYLALTPSCVMAGGQLSAIYRSGNLRASFELAAHFLIAWKPYHYTASLWVRFRASYRVRVDLGDLGSIEETISASISAGVELWGPEFGGMAFVDLEVVSLEVDFGASYAWPASVSWAEFEDGFLPDADQRVSFNITSGAIAEIDSLTVIDAASFGLELSLVIPARPGDDSVGSSAAADFGVAPMDVSSVHRSEVQVIVKRNGEIYDDLTVAPVLKAGPAALWGSSNRSSAELVADLVMGYRFVRSDAIEPKSSPRRPASDFEYDETHVENAFTPALPMSRSEEQRSFDAVVAGLQAADAVARRTEVLTALGLAPDFVTTARAEDDIHGSLVASPRIARMAAASR